MGLEAGDEGQDLGLLVVHLDVEGRGEQQGKDQQGWQKMCPDIDGFIVP